MHLAATLYMVGVIWMVQLAHYPLMALVGAEQMEAWQLENMRRTTWVVGPPMLVEAATAAVLIIMDEASYLGFIPWMGAALLVLVWVSTALLQVPAHDSLSRGLSVATVSWLVSSNWIRTVLWSVRGGLALYMVHLSWGRL